MTLDTDALFDQLCTFLAYAEDPDAGAELYALYHPESRVISNFEPQPVGPIGQGLFGLMFKSSWDVYAMHHPDAPRRPAVSEPTLLSARSEGDDRAVTWWEAAELNDEQPLVLAVGFRREGEDWLIGWLTLAERVADWGYAMGEAQTLADFPYARANMDLMPRSTLDLAHFRLYGHDQRPIATLPSARFTCGMSSVCCAIDYRIAVPAGAQAFLDAVPWDEVAPALAGTRLAPAEDGELILKPHDAPCRFRDEHRHCLIHKAFGRPVFPACTQFPLAFAHTPEGVTAAASPLCGAVRGGMGPLLSERQAELRGRLAIEGEAQLARPKAFRLARALEVPWEVFRDTERLLLGALDRRDLPFWRRLDLGCRALAAARAGSAALDPAWAHEALPAPDPAEADRAERLLERVLAGLDFAASAEMHGAAETAQAPFEDWMAVTVSNLLYSKVFSYPLGLTAAHHVGVLLYVVADRLRARYAPAPVPDPVLINVAMRIFHGQLARFLAEEPEAVALLDAPWLGRTWLAIAAAA